MIRVPIYRRTDTYHLYQMILFEIAYYDSDACKAVEIYFLGMSQSREQVGTELPR